MRELREAPPSPPRYRAGESGDYSSARINGRSRPADSLTKWAVKIGLGLMVLAFTGLVGWAFTAIDEKATKGVEAKSENVVLRLEQGHIKEDVKDLKDGQKTITKGMQTILRTLYTLPSDRRQNPMPVLEVPGEEDD